MKKFFLLLMFLTSVQIFAQTKVAVYVVESKVEDEIKKIIGSEMVSAIVVNVDYQAVERTSTFLEQLSKEQGCGNDQQISTIGKQIGVDDVCVIDITAYQSSFYVQARLLDVNNTIVLATAREISPLSSIDEIIATTERLASKLIGEDAVVNQVERNYSSIGYVSDDTKNFHMISVDNSGTLVKVTFKYCTPIQTNIYIKPETHLYCKSNDVHCRLIETEGISLEPKNTTIPAGIYTFSLYFEKLPDDVCNIDFIEPEGWCIYDITLRPFGKKNYHLFVDNSESNYESICLQYSQYLQQQQKDEQLAKEAGESIAKTMSKLFSYNLNVINTKTFPRAIWVGGIYVGEVAGNSTRTFELETSCYGAVKSVQTKGYVLSPSSESFYISKPSCQQTVVWTIR